MPIYTEGRVELTFPSGWQICKYDECRFYREKLLKAVPGTKSIDLLVRDPDLNLYLTELKDFRGHAAANRGRIVRGELWLEVAQKVRDTVAGLWAAHRDSDTTLAPFSDLLMSPSTQIKILAWVDRDQSQNLHELTAMMAATDQLKRQMKWLSNAKAKLASKDEIPTIWQGVTLRQLPNAPAP